MVERRANSRVLAVMAVLADSQARRAYASTPTGRVTAVFRRREFPDAGQGVD